MFAHVCACVCVHGHMEKASMQPPIPRPSRRAPALLRAWLRRHDPARALAPNTSAQPPALQGARSPLGRLGTQPARGAQACQQPHVHRSCWTRHHAQPRLRPRPVSRRRPLRLNGARIATPQPRSSRAGSRCVCCKIAIAWAVFPCKQGTMNCESDTHTHTQAVPKHAHRHTCMRVLMHMHLHMRTYIHAW